MPCPKLLTTGQMAKMLSVTPDTVLKWIKQDKLPASRTAGGHYRVSPDALDSLLPQGKYFAPRASLGERHFSHCWEFFAAQGKTRSGCQECLIFHSQARKCFAMNRLPPESGAKCESCADSCARCPYYHTHWGGPFKILVVTENPACRNALMKQGAPPPIQFQFVSGEYESSRVVDWFRPDLVIVDGTMPETKVRNLCRHLANDRLIPDATILWAAPPRRKGTSVPGVTRIRNPISLKEVENHLDRVKKTHSAHPQREGFLPERKRDQGEKNDRR